MSNSNDFIPIANPDLTGNEKKYLNECIDTGWVSYKGRFVKELEDNFSEMIGVKYGIACSSGTSALHLALAALGLGPGDEVIVPTLTFIASVNAIHYVGATPVFIDSEPETGNMNPDLLESLITNKTKAIIPVHLYGHPVDMDPVLEIAKAHGLVVVEDAAEAHGAEYKGRKVGSLGDISIFSFFGNKVMTSGEGGIVVTSNEELAKKVRMLRDQGLDPESRSKFYYKHDIIGFNYGMSNLQAAVGVAQLERLDQFIQKRRSDAEYYQKLLSDCPSVTVMKEQSWAKSIYWMVSVLVNQSSNLNRDELIAALKAENIETRPFFYPIHTLNPYKHLSEGKEFPIAMDLGQRGLNVPTFTDLTDQQIERVCNTIKRLVG